MKQLVEINVSKKPEENDIIIFKNGNWTVCDKASAFSHLYEELKLLKANLEDEKNQRLSAISSLSREIESLKSSIRYLLGE